MIQNTKELYDKMCSTHELCGKFELVEDTIFWDLFDGYDVQISVNWRDSYFSIDRRLFGKVPDPLIHWHPEQEEVFDQVCDIGLKGNVLVVRKNWIWTSVIYKGKEDACPYSPDKKWSWGRIYYLKAK